MKRTIAVTALAVSLVGGLFTCGTSRVHRSGAARVSAHAATVYICPMHPHYHSDHPGDCPICGMRLELKHGAGPTGGEDTTHTLPPGAVQVSPERQQAIG